MGDVGLKQHTPTAVHGAFIDLHALLRRYGVLFALMGLAILFGVLRREFLDPRNLVNLLRQVSMLTIAATGLTFAMIVGEFDLSFGEVCGLAGVAVTSLLLAGYGFSTALACGLLLGAGFGLLNGVMTVKVGIPSFITTLGSMSLAIGFNFFLTRGQPVYGSFPPEFSALGRGFVGAIPIPVLVAAGVVVVSFVVAERMAIGRYMYATGGNIVAAMHSGIRVARYRILGLVLSGTYAALAGVILSSRLGSGQPTAGSGFLLDGFAAAFLGTTVMKDGLPNVIGTLVGVAVLGVLSNGMTLLGLPYYAENIVKGAVLLGAVTVSRVAARAGR
ncbi:ABC transporter permease [Geochorda subterranea]|uniref:ABC transporter permease n=1 Tax=Geochorda subterranea TaxID=3109564 RepID=A0ABZ1BPU7_9FIRM|nr:ABC transporter permease [Limnochorda sp. LNt]WRP14729.1 ABC transporter permease [Limnochorda sp. LNt]